MLASFQVVSKPGQTPAGRHPDSQNLPKTLKKQFLCNLNVWPAMKQHIKRPIRSLTQEDSQRRQDRLRPGSEPGRVSK